MENELINNFKNFEKSKLLQFRNDTLTPTMKFAVNMNSLGTELSQVLQPECENDASLLLARSVDRALAARAAALAADCTLPRFLLHIACMPNCDSVIV